MRFRILKATLLSLVLAVGVLAGPALADYPPAEPPKEPEVVEVVVEKPAPEVVEVEAPVAVSEMPVTGSDAAGLSVIGVAMLALGALAVRRRSPADLG